MGPWVPSEGCGARNSGCPQREVGVLRGSQS